MQQPTSSDTCNNLNDGVDPVMIPPFRVTTWNLLTELFLDRAVYPPATPAKEERWLKIRNTLYELRSDVFLLQEVDASTRERLAESFSADYWVSPLFCHERHRWHDCLAPGTSWENHGVVSMVRHCSTLYRSEAFSTSKEGQNREQTPLPWSVEYMCPVPLAPQIDGCTAGVVVVAVRSRRRRLGVTADGDVVGVTSSLPGGSHGPGGEKRDVLLRFYNVHLDHAERDRRVAQVRDLLADAEQWTRHVRLCESSSTRAVVVMGGDWNEIEAQGTPALLPPAFARCTSHDDTFFDATADDVSWCLDRVYVRGPGAAGRPVRCSHGPDAPPRTVADVLCHYGSDHRPVTCCIETL